MFAAAADAGVRVTLLDACYLAGGIGRPLRGPQKRFGDGTAGDWARRVDDLYDRTGKADHRHARVGAAVHSVRAVPREQIGAVADWARRLDRHVRGGGFDAGLPHWAALPVEEPVPTRADSARSVTVRLGRDETDAVLRDVPDRLPVSRRQWSVVKGLVS